MLVLTRKNNEKLMIGNSIVVTIIDCIKDRVRIGITAPKSVEVLRGELFAKSGHKVSEVDESEQLKEIIKHCYIHSGDKNCGRDQMESWMKEMYDRIIEKDEANAP